MVTLTQSFLIRFLPNFIYGLLPSTSFKLKYGFCLISDIQDGRQDDCHVHISISAVGVTLTQSFRSSSFKFEYWFCQTSDNQDGRQNGRHLSISTVVVTLTLSFLIRFLPTFIHGLLPSTSFKFKYGFCLTSDNQDGRQNGRHLSISTVVVTLTQSF